MVNIKNSILTCPLITNLLKVQLSEFVILSHKTFNKVPVYLYNLK